MTVTPSGALLFAKATLVTILSANLCVADSLDSLPMNAAGKLIGSYYQGAFIYPETFGARGDGRTDDSAAFTEAMKACSRNHGGRIQLAPKQYLVDTANVTFSANCAIFGGSFPGTLRSGIDGTEALDYSAIPYTIRLNPKYSILLSRASVLQGVTVIASNLVTPKNMQDGLLVRQGMHGIAISQISAPTGSTVRDVLVLGFGQCIKVSGFGNVKIIDFAGDCTNGISLDNSHDISLVENAEMFGWLTTNQPWSTFLSKISRVTRANNGSQRVHLDTPMPLKAGSETLVWISGLAGGGGGRHLGTVIGSNEVELSGVVYSQSDVSNGSLYINLNYREGVAFQLTNSDGGTFAHTFAFNYAVAYHLGDGANFPTLDDATFDADGAEKDDSSIGYLIDGSANSVSIGNSSFQSEAFYGMLVNTSGLNAPHTISAPRISCNGHPNCKAVEVRSGNLTILGGAVYNSIRVASGARVSAVAVEANTLSRSSVTIEAGAEFDVIGGRWPKDIKRVEDR